MTTPDLAPTRLDRARQKLADLLKARDGMPAGLIAYSGSAHLVLLPTPDPRRGRPRPCVSRRRSCRAKATGSPTPWHSADRTLRGDGQGGSILVIAETVAPDQTESARVPAFRCSHSSRCATAPSPPMLLWRRRCRPSMPGRSYHDRRCRCGGDLTPAGRRRARRSPARANAGRMQATGWCRCLRSSAPVPPGLGGGDVKRLLPWLAIRVRSASSRWPVRPGRRAEPLWLTTRPARPAPDGPAHYAEAPRPLPYPMRRRHAPSSAPPTSRRRPRPSAWHGTAEAAYDQGTALVMLGKYDDAITPLRSRPGAATGPGPTPKPTRALARPRASA